MRVTPHTPEPWHMDGNRILDADGWYIAEIDPKYTGENAEANAHLIIAAPELLEACVSAIECPALNLDDLEEADRDAICLIRTAIALAEGRTL